MYQITEKIFMAMACTCMSQYDKLFYGGGRRRIKVYKNKEVTDGGNSMQILSPGTKICVCKRIYIQAIMYA